MSARPPVVYSQLSVNDPQRTNDCGEVVDAELLSVGGVAATPAQVIDMLGHDGVTNANELVSLLRSNGASVQPGVTWQQTVDGVAAGGWGLTLIRDNNDADPSPTGTHSHWVLPYNVNADGSVQTLNSWPDASGNGRDVAYASALLSSAYQWGAVVTWPPQEDNDVAGNIDTYSAPDGQHVCFVDGAGNLYDGRVTPGGTDWGDGPGKPPNPDHAVLKGVKPFAAVRGMALGGTPHLYVTGALGDCPHMAFTGGKWNRQSS